jgi:hypothetical protein
LVGRSPAISHRIMQQFLVDKSYKGFFYIP